MELENWIVGVGYYKFGSTVIRIKNPTIGVRHYKCRTADSPELWLGVDNSIRPYCFGRVGINE